MKRNKGKTNPHQNNIISALNPEEMIIKFYNHIRDAILFIDYEQKILAYNNSFRDIFEVGSGVLKNTSIKQLFDDEKDYGRFSDLLDEGDFSRENICKCVLKAHSGKSFSAEINCFIPKETEKENSVYGISIRNIDLQKQTETELHDNLERIKTIGDNLPQGMIYSKYVSGPDSKPQFIYLSDQAEHLFGCKVADALEDSDLIFGRFEKNDQQKITAYRRKSMKTLRPFHIEVQVKHPGGHGRWYRLTSQPRKHKGGYIFDGLLLEVTKSRRNEQLLVEKTKSLSERVKELNALYNVSQSITTERPIGEVLQEVADFLPESWQYPGITSCRIGYKDQEYLSSNHKEGKDIQAAQLLVNGKKAGSIEIHYQENKPAEEEGPFLAEERTLINNLAAILSKYLEQESAKSRIKFQSLLVNAVGDAVMATDLQGNITFWNKAAETVYGWNAGEVLGKNIAEVTPSDEMMESASEIMDYIMKGKTWSGEFLVRRKSGESFPALVTDSPLFDSEGQIIGIIGVSRDISERRKAEKNLVESEERFKDIALSMPGAIYQFLLTKEGNFKIPYMSQSAVQYFGIPMEHLLNANSLFSYLYDDDLEPFINSVRQSAAILKPWNMIFRVKQQDGSVKWLQGRSNPRKLDEGSVLWNGVVIDITDTKNAEMEIRRNEERLKEAQEIAKTGYFELNVDTSSMFWSEAIYNMLDMSSDEQALNKDEFKKLVYPEDQYKLDFYLNHVLDNNESVQYDLHLKTLKGKEKYFSITGSPRFNKAHNVDRVIGTAVDITDRKELEQDLIVAKVKAEESDRLKTAFLLNISHEIRTPLNGILGFLDLLHDTDITKEEQEHYIEMVNEGSDRLLNTVDDVMEISRIESGLVSPVFKTFDLNRLMDDLYFGFSSQVDNNRVLLKCNKAGTAKQFPLESDKNKLYRILSNLIGNAVKFTPEGSVEFGYRTKGKWLEFYVEDTGIGIAPERQEAVFDRFVHADTTLTRPYEGAGLGLAISKAHVEMLGGKILVKSAPGEGSRFYFTLPRRKVEISDVQSEEPAGASKKPDRDYKILIVEDTNSSSEYLAEIVGEISSEVLFAETGSEAVNICRQHPDIDIILMDIKLPEMDGYEATQKIREFNKDVLVIAQTAFALEGDHQKALRAGCDDYLPKPIKKRDLIKLISDKMK